ncbi:lysine N(6)-hydroxylase/L-ornithine N(5)-oxygenase family protein [Phytoactinopolyspora halotolerans]|uniref:L-lysine N6-monooxygenase MbtG n=1 Tax=Phytoactinopolyspora halotolerans TaxID=1981512 RepID=A0A6L9SFK6_9ACTN|nr:SidA/IucD/PvdA family monooxygenase [Phytoactinopolyspora halotolerans]NEE03863.1 SidA/IucD/PvdA family monooxygenase [Phytoactinopolyspora halotolerans]
MTPPRLTDDPGRTLDVVGVGLGPFNLGLAALLDPVPDVDAVFLEAAPSFAWHPGLMLPGTTLQVPFMADLVTLADPTNRYSFLNYLHEHNRLYRFYFYERFHIPRREYDAYARWVAQSLPSCRFGHRVDSVEPNDDGTWTVRVVPGRSGSGRPAGPRDEGDIPVSDCASESITTLRARSVVFGVGSRPRVPAVVRDLLGDDIFHTSEYLTLRDKAIDADVVTVVGSGQSAGEVVADLLEARLANGHATGKALDWFTRGPGFLPMEYSKLGLEHFTPEYTAYFRNLPEPTRDRIRAGQDLLYKGLSAETSERIYDLLYEATVDAADPPVTYAARCELTALEPSPVPGRRWRLTWRHGDEDRTFTRDTDVVILGTGYEPAPLPVPPGLLVSDERGRPDVTGDYRLRIADDGGPGTAGRASSLFVQNAEMHTHGVGTPDLGLGAYRSSVIANAIAGREVYPIRDRTVFQRFGTAALAADAPAPLSSR